MEKGVKLISLNFRVARRKNLSSPCNQSLTKLAGRVAYSRMLLSNWKEVVRTTRAAPTVFILARIRCMFGGTDFPYAP
jgi:hypothetical protein